jgi:hypothetical protein
MAKTKMKLTVAKQKEIKPNDIKKSESGIATIPGVKTEMLTTLIIGISPLMTHKFSEKARQKILDTHIGEAVAGREKKDPHANFMAARYRLTDGSDGVPAGGLKACIVRGFIKGSGVFATKAKGAIRITADDPTSNLVRILTPTEPSMREDCVRNASGVVDIRHRPEYWPWAMRLEVEYLPSIASARQILQAIATAGFIEGIGEWRPGSKDSLSGTLGSFRLAEFEEVKAYEQGRLFKSATTTSKPRKKSGDLALVAAASAELEEVG